MPKERTYQSQENYNPDSLLISATEDGRQEFEHLQKLVYAVYTKNGIPAKVDSHPEPADPKTRSVYLTASYPDLEILFDKPEENQSRIKDQLREIKSPAGFMKIEWGENPEGKTLMNSEVWHKNPPIGYVGSFTVNPLLPRIVKLDIQRLFHNKLYQIAKDNGFSDHIFTILKEHVLKFVHDSGLSAEPVDRAELNWNNPNARRVFEAFPKYWLEDPRPQIFRFIPPKT